MGRLMFAHIDYPYDNLKRKTCIYDELGHSISIGNFAGKELARGNSVMNQNEFWSLIADINSDSDNSCEAQAQLIGERLAEMDANEIRDFESIFLQLLDQAYSWHLWSAAIIIGGVCSDDCFLDFRAWLIGQGKEIYLVALDDPETLVNVVQMNEITDEPNFNCEQLNYVADKAFEKTTGKELNSSYTFTNRTPKGENRDISEWLKMYPKLAEKFWSRF